MNNNQRFDTIEKKIFRIETILWYLAITGTLKIGTELFPMVQALMK